MLLEIKANSKIFSTAVTEDRLRLILTAKIYYLVDFLLNLDKLGTDAFRNKSQQLNIYIEWY